jgi:hypothetical protein
LRIAITIVIEKLIRIDRDPIFVVKSIRDLSGKIDPLLLLDLTLLGAPLSSAPAAWASPALGGRCVIG